MFVPSLSEDRKLIHTRASPSDFHRPGYFCGYVRPLDIYLLISGQRHGIFHLQSCHDGRVSNSCNALHSVDALFLFPSWPAKNVSSPTVSRLEVGWYYCLKGTFLFLFLLDIYPASCIIPVI